MKYKDKLISFAEVIDAWRIVPRSLVVAYMYMVYKLYIWFTNLETFVERTCDVGMMKFLTEAGEMDINSAMEIACRITDVVGGPTTAQSMFVTTVTGLSVGIFGLYTSTGRKWGKKGEMDSPVIHNYPHDPYHNRHNRVNHNRDNNRHPVVDSTHPSSNVDPVKFEP